MVGEGQSKSQMELSRGPEASPSLNNFSNNSPVFHLTWKSWYFYCFHSFTFSRMSYTWNHTVYSPFRLASFPWHCVHLKFLHVFSWLDSPFFFSLTMIISNLFLYILLIYHVYCLSSPHDRMFHKDRDSCLLCSLLYLQCQQWCSAHGRCSGNTDWLNWVT